MANNKNFIAKNGVSTGDGYAMPDIRPSLLLDFANSKTLDPRITFTRGSTATYWDGHTTTKAEENLFKRSSEFNDAFWAKGNTTVTANATTAPDGTTTADKLLDNNQNQQHNIDSQLAVSSTNIQVFSVYAKGNGEGRYLKLYGWGLGSQEEAPVFDVDNGVLYNPPTSVYFLGATITDVGNGWYRCTLKADTDGGSGSPAIAMTNATDAHGTESYVGDGSGFFIWGAQLETRESVTAFTATTTSPIVKYQPTLQTAASGEARFDHDPATGESKGLLIEESRVNYDTYSDFSNAYGTSRVNYYADYAIAPDGTQSAIMLEVNEVGTVQGLWSNNYTTSLGTYYTTSVHVRKETNAELSAEFTMYIRNSIGAGSIYGALVWDTAAGFVSFTGNAATNATYQAEDLGDWWRLSITTNEIPTGDERTSFRMNSEPLGKRIILWGRQWEVGAFPTSYIPTSGSTVTRSRDDAIMTGSNFTDWYNYGEGTLYAEAPVSAASGIATQIMASINDNTNTNAIQVYSNSQNNITAQVIAFSTSYYSEAVSSTDGSGNAAIGYALDNTFFAANGVGDNSGTDTSVQPPSLVDQLRIGSYANGGLSRNGPISKIAFYSQRLSNATLQQMTEE